MPRSKMREELAEEGMTRFLRKQDEDEQSTQLISDNERTFVTRLKVFIKGEFQKVNIELNDIRQNLGTLDLCLTSIDGKLNGLETCFGQLQRDLLAVNRKVDIIEKKSVGIKTTLREFEEDIGCIENLEKGRKP